MGELFDRWFMEERIRLRVLHPQSMAILSPLVDYRTPRQIMDELRAEDPEAAMLLGEYIVLDDDEAGS